ncbi:MAG: hypothetical protein NWR22_08015, partial [Saprospiraceae bacterium]|nr:hypothetical protein [Saprospiraceae bacterium]
RINIAKKHPEIVEGLLEEYENWFDEVTEEREAKGVQRIYLGNKIQPNTTLTRFDWGGPRVISRFDYGGPRVIEDNQLGHWRVKSEKGAYKVSLDLPELTSEGIAHIKYNEVHYKLPFKEGQKTMVFESIILPESTGNFHVYLKAGRLAVGPHFVHVEKIK